MIPANKMQALVDVQWAVEQDVMSSDTPNEDEIQSWVDAVLHDQMNPVELTIRVVDEPEISELNQQYRNRQGATNVLSFPVDHDLPLPVPLLGDLVICAPVVEKEAQQQHKPLKAHWAHMIIHGTLHLLGYDHIEAQQAQQMEHKEIEILHSLGFANPYEVNSHA